MATAPQIQAGIEALAEYEFRYMDLLKADDAPAGSGHATWVGCISTYPESRPEFVAKMLARSRCCESSEAYWHQVGQELGLQCKKPYVTFDAKALGAERVSSNGRLRGTLYAFDHNGPCGLADFSVGLDNWDVLSSVPHFCLRLDGIYLSEDRRGERLGAELAACAASAMLQVVTDVAQSITQRGRLEITFDSLACSISGWVASWYAAAYLAQRIGAEPSGYVEGRLRSRPVTLECVIED